MWNIGGKCVRCADQLRACPITTGQYIRFGLKRVGSPFLSSGCASATHCFYRYATVIRVVIANMLYGQRYRLISSWSRSKVIVDC